MNVNITLLTISTCAARRTRPAPSGGGTGASVVAMVGFGGGLALGGINDLLRDQGRGGQEDPAVGVVQHVPGARVGSGSAGVLLRQAEDDQVVLLLAGQPDQRRPGVAGRRVVELQSPAQVARPL